MSFLHPALAAVGFACIAIPIIIHLLMRRKRKPIMWGAMRFLLEAYRKHKRRLRLEQFLLLATRCLLVALIAMALARPMLGSAGVLGSGRQATTMYLLIDNSLTASAIGADGRSALTGHKDQAIEALEQLDSALGDRVALIAMGGPAQPIVLPPTSDLGAIRTLIESLESTDSAMDLAGAAQAVATHMDQPDTMGGRSAVVLLSSFRAGSADLERALPQLATSAQPSNQTSPGSSGETTVLASIPTEFETDNVSIISAEPLRSIMIAGGEPDAQGESSSVRVVLRRSGPGIASASTTNLTVRLVGSQGGEARASVQVQFKPGQVEIARILSLAAAPGQGRAVLHAELSPDAVGGDNVWQRPIEVRSSLRVATISPRRRLGSDGLNPENSADWLRVALSPIAVDRERFTGAGALDAIDVVNIDPSSLDAARLADLDAVFVTNPEMIDADGWARLRVLADSGALVAVMPPSSETVSLWADEFTSAMELPWTIGREGTVYESPMSLETDRSAVTEPDLLAIIAPELAELTRPVRIFRSHSISVPSGEGEVVLALADGSPFVVAGTPGSTGHRGFVVLFGSSLGASWTDLATQPVFLPLVQEILRQGIGRATGTWTSTAGLPIALPVGVTELQPTGARASGTNASVSATRPPAMRNAGVWRALDDRGVERGLIAVNADASAGDTRIQAGTSVESWLNQLSPKGIRWLASKGTGEQTANTVSVGELLSGDSNTARSSLPLLIGALLLAVLEIGLARWFSHAALAPDRTSAHTDAGAIA